MFDIGFLEIIVVGVVGLLVIGPERLPGAIRSGSMWFGTLKRNLTSAREEFERQIGADEIRRELHNADVMHSLEKARQSLSEQIASSAKAAEQESVNSIAPPTDDSSAHAQQDTEASDTVDKPFFGPEDMPVADHPSSPLVKIAAEERARAAAAAKLDQQIASTESSADDKKPS
jgi:twin arginine-targeting protein translocase TatB